MSTKVTQESRAEYIEALREEFLKEIFSYFSDTQYGRKSRVRDKFNAIMLAAATHGALTEQERIENEAFDPETY